MAIPDYEHDAKQPFYFKPMLAHFVHESVCLLKIYIPALILGEDLRACFRPRVMINLISSDMSSMCLMINATCVIRPKVSRRTLASGATKGSRKKEIFLVACPLRGGGGSKGRATKKKSFFDAYF